MGHAGDVSPVPESAPPPTADAALASALARIEVKLDSALRAGADHETRLRVVEQRRTVSPRDLWLGLTGAAAAGGSIAALFNALTP